MRFIIGLLLGLGIGFAGALLLAPEKRERREGAPGGEEPAGEEGVAEDHDAVRGGVRGGWVGHAGRAWVLGGPVVSNPPPSATPPSAGPAPRINGAGVAQM